MKNTTIQLKSAHYIKPFLPQNISVHYTHAYPLSYTNTSPSNSYLYIRNGKINYEHKNMQELSSILHLKISQQTIVLKATINEVITNIKKWLYL